MTTLSTTIQTEGARATPFRDTKRLLWLVALFPPALAVLCVGLALDQGSAAWFWLFHGLLYLGVPLLDAVIGGDTFNPPESAVPDLEADPYYRALGYVIIVASWAAILAVFHYVGTHDLPWYLWLPTVMTAGGISGFSMVLAHEIGHKPSALDRAMALLALIPGGYVHFCVEHNRGHHRYVSTPDDPASSRMGESIYRFMFRELPGAFFRGWDLECQRLDRLGRSQWSLHNEIVRGWLGTAVLWGALIAVYGVKMVPVLLLSAFWGAFQLTSANYIEHYGLLRKTGADGRLERCEPRHSWNSNHLVSNLMTLHLQRHSDHHANPVRAYQALRDYGDVPNLPSGYLGMYLLAYMPPLWFRVMDPRLIATVKGDAAAINFEPGKKARLMKRYGLH